ncbi:DUF1295 domain-containing protein [Roseivirga misakiensis]|uniref:Uncharacterized protein n=1 Tax=Roseivirga misakiensis TaxID=1563681 RepID=A0A1E5T205_9BACT|nr:DUF1295 domain-containing protein [Roseivirga misakiensis]OEK05389.1 hypothetical protein BFP71_18535 [Roseivirga misakiensis]
MTNLVTNILLLGLAYANFWFIVSLLTKRNDIADVAWGMGYVGICVFLFLNGYQSDLSLLVYVLVGLWGGRLSLYIGLRNSKKKEDFRYNQWRNAWGSNFYWRSYLQVYILQVALLMIVSIPIVLTAQSTNAELTFISGLGTVLWVIGFYWQVVGDRQLSKFKKIRTDKEQVLQTGLWKYSRHPNYFGEILMWWGIAAIVLPMPYGWIGLASPMLITYLLLFVSGVPMLERRYAKNEAFQKYKEKTPPVFPKLSIK